MSKIERSANGAAKTYVMIIKNSDVLNSLYLSMFVSYRVFASTLLMHNDKGFAAHLLHRNHFFYHQEKNAGTAK